MNFWDANVLNKMVTENLWTFGQKGLRITAETSTVSDGGISYWKHNDIICFFLFLHVCNKYIKSCPNTVLITVNLKLMGISFRLGLTTNVNVGDGEMRTSTSLITEMSDKQLDNNQKQSPDKKNKKQKCKTTEWEPVVKCNRVTIRHN